MNATTAKANFGKINMAELPAELKTELTVIKKETSDFTATGAEANGFYNNFADLYSIIEGAFPQALKASKSAKKSKAVAAAKNIIRAKAVWRTPAAKPKRKASKKATSPKPQPAPKLKAIPKTKTPKVKKAAAPRVARKTVSSVSKAEKSMAAKRLRYDNMKKHLAEYKIILRSNDKVKMQIAREAQKQFNAIASLGRSSFDVSYDKLVIEYKLYREFVKSDKAKFKGIRERAIGKIVPSLGAKRKPATKKKPTPKKKVEKKSFFGKLFS